jgi:hypothetical protein
MSRSAEQLKSELAEALSGVDGWLDLETAWLIHELARCFPAPARDITVVELGCWKGRTTMALALGLKARGGGKVYSIDPHTGSEQTIRLLGYMDTYDAFVENIKASQLAGFVEPIRATAHQACGRFQENSVHILIVDASREYDEVVQYVDDWSATLTEGAIAAFRDPSGIYPALHQRALRRGSIFRWPAFTDDSTGSVMLLEVRRPAPWTFKDSFTIGLLWLQHLAYALSRVRVVRKRMPDWVGSFIESADSALGRAASGGRLHRYLSEWPRESGVD